MKGDGVFDDSEDDDDDKNKEKKAEVGGGGTRKDDAVITSTTTMTAMKMAVMIYQTRGFSTQFYLNLASMIFFF